MINIGHALSRREVLRGLGAAIALPMLDAMTPAFATTIPPSAKRLGFVYVPNGVLMDNWTPKDTNQQLLPPILSPLDPFREHLLVVSGLSNSGLPRNSAVHASASTKFLTCSNPQQSELAAGTSCDQVAAAELGRYTQLASLELGLESAEVGTCDIGFSCAYTNTISWRSPSTPLPMEVNPRVVFEQLFGDSGSTSRSARMERRGRQRSILDSVSEKLGRLQASLGAGDQRKLSEYLSALRDVERRIQRAEEQSDRDLPVVEQPAGIPETFEAHARLMYDLQALAFEADLTRVVTFMLGREFSGRSYPEIGVRDAHHPTSHHEGIPEKMAKVTKINTYHVNLFSYFLEKLQATTDGDGSLLDHSLILYGAGMSDGNSHSHNDLPILLAGGGMGAAAGIAHLRAVAETPLANLHLALLERLGIDLDRFGNGTERLDLGVSE